MKIKFLNKTIEPKRFDYNPRYYDERKERVKQRQEHYRKLSEGSYNDNERRENFKDNIRAEWSRSQVRQHHRRSSNMRTMILVALILALGYFIFNGVDEVDAVVNKIW